MVLRAAAAGEPPARDPAKYVAGIQEPAVAEPARQKPQSGPGEGGRKPWFAPYLSRPQIKRPELEDAIVRLLGATDDQVVTITTGVHGAGGFGKTTIAAQVCRRAEIQAEFDGGLLWVTVGESAHGADLAARVNDLVEHLTGARPALTDPEQAGFRLGAALDEHPGRVLMVVDDVWTSEQLWPFTLGGSRCRRLITTRNQRIVPPGATVVVDQMRQEQAVALLTRDLPSLPNDVVDELVRRTGRWPVLLELVNGNLQRALRHPSASNPVLEAHSVLERLSALGPSGLDPISGLSPVNRTQRHHAVRTTVEASFAVTEPLLRERYFELGIFAEDTEIPLTVLSLLWDPSSERVVSPVVSRICSELSELSLVTLRRGAVPTVRLHDVLRSYIRAELGDRGIRRVTGQFLDSTRSLFFGSVNDPDVTTPWWSLPDSSEFLFQHLATHLHDAGRSHELAGLVTDLRWIQARISQAGPAAIEADLSKAHGPKAALLREAIRRNAHLLRPLEPARAIGTTLLSRLTGGLTHDTDELRAVVDKFQTLAELPTLANLWPLPDVLHPAFSGTLAGHAAGTCAVACSSEESWFATAGRDGMVRIWDRVGRRLRYELRTAVAELFAVEVVPSRGWLAAAGDKGTVHFWDIVPSDPHFRVRGAFRLSKKRILAMAFAADGTWMVTGGFGGTVHFWDTSDGRKLGSLRTGQPAVHGISISPDGTWMATAGSSGRTVRVWSIGPRYRCQLQSEHNLSGWATSVCITADGRFSVAGDSEGLLHVWDSDWRRIVKLTSGHLHDVSAVTVSSDGMVMLTADGEGGPVRLWDFERSLRSLDVDQEALPEEDVFRMSVSPDGTFLATSSLGSGSVNLWSTADRRHLAELQADLEGLCSAIAFAPDGSWVAVADSDDPIVVMFHVASSGDAEMIELDFLISDVAVARDGTWMAVAGDGGICILHSVQQRRIGTWHRVQLSTKHSGRGVHAVAIGPDDHWFAASEGQNATVKVWSGADITEYRPDHQPTHIWRGEGAGTYRTTTDGCSNRLFVFLDADLSSGKAVDEGVVYVWDALTGAEELRFHTGHEGGIYWVSVRPSDGCIATVGVDGSLRVFDQSGRPMAAVRVDSNLRSCGWLAGTSKISAAGRQGVYLFDYRA